MVLSAALIAVLMLSLARPALAPTGAPAHDLDALVAALSEPDLEALDRVLLLNAWNYVSIEAFSPEGPRPVLVPRAGMRAHADAILQTLSGQCGHREIVMRAALSALGLEARRVGFFGVPVQHGHTALEVKVEGEWVFVDPTFGLYFARPDSPRVPLSIERARAAYPDVVLARVETAGWTGRWADPAPLRAGFARRSLYRLEPVGPTLVANPRDPDHLVADVEQTYFASSHAAHYRDPIFSTRVIDLASEPAGQLGRGDGDHADLLAGPRMSYGTAYMPELYVLGGTGPGGELLMFHEYLLLAREAGGATLEIDFVGDVPATHLSRFLVDIDSAVAPGLRNTRVQRELTDATLRLRFEVTPPLTRLRLSLGADHARGAGYLVDSVRWSTGPPPSSPSSSPPSSPSPSAPSPSASSSSASSD